MSEDLLRKHVIKGEHIEIIKEILGVKDLTFASRFFLGDWNFDTKAIENAHIPKL